MTDLSKFFLLLENNFSTPFYAQTYIGCNHTYFFVYTIKYDYIKMWFKESEMLFYISKAK
jgi:hypothetical protein